MMCTMTMTAWWCPCASSKLPKHVCREVRKCEKPLYSVIRPLGSKRNWWDGKSPAELRQYAPMLIAQVAGQSPRLWACSLLTYLCDHCASV
jgi:hypothetical protein